VYSWAVTQHFLLLCVSARNLAMEITSPALTIEDILSIHREWITKLLTEDEHTEAEILGILGKRNLFVKYTYMLFINP
jgi:hypothetical protein